MKLAATKQFSPVLDTQLRRSRGTFRIIFFVIWVCFVRRVNFDTMQFSTNTTRFCSARLCYDQRFRRIRSQQENVRSNDPLRRLFQTFLIKRPADLAVEKEACVIYVGLGYATVCLANLGHMGQKRKK